ncbi:MAG: hypothetical protein ACFFB3_21930 [Candidatus Hodarchaeota archaeon]
MTLDESSPKRTPLFLKTKLVTSYVRVIAFLVIIGIPYVAALLIASEYDPFDRQFGILRDAFVLILPSFLLIGVFVLRRLLDGIFQRVPVLTPTEGQKYDEERDEAIRFSRLFAGKGYEEFGKYVRCWAYSKYEYLFVLFLVSLVMIASYDAQWTLDGFTYGGRTEEPYTTISGVMLMLGAIILAAHAASALWFLMAFIFAISRLDKASAGAEKEFSLNIRIGTRQDESQEPLSYHIFHSHAKTIGEFMFMLCFGLLFLALVFSVMVGFNQLVTVSETNLLGFFVVFCIDFFILALFFVPQVGMHRILRRAKTLSLVSLEEKFMALQNRYVPEAEKLIRGEVTDFEHFDRLEAAMGTLSAMIEKEQSASTWAFEPPAVLGLVGGAVLTLLSLAVQVVLDLLQNGS